MSKDTKKALEHCVEWNCDNCPNGDDLGSGEIVCRGRLLSEVLKYVSDLEAKLAESEKDKQFYFFENGEKGLKIRELKQQLAEKEKELAEYTDINNTLNSGLQEKCILCEEEHNQDKISFCIEKLEKVKELMRNIDMPNKPELYNNDMFGAGFDSHYIRVEKLIDNQINELKGEE